MKNRARGINVIETTALRGRGTNEDPVRSVNQYWDFNSNLLAENDCIAKEKEWLPTHHKFYFTKLCRFM